jgi:hypothetical protein
VKSDDFIAMLAIALFLLILILAPGDEPPLDSGWDYDPPVIREAITPELVDALCPPYSELTFFEDGTYTCTPG